MSSRVRSRLGLKFTSVAALALVLAFAVYLLLYEGVIWWLLNSANLKWKDAGARAVESFQEYVTERGLTTDEAVRDVNWESQYRSMYLYLTPIPDDSIPETIEPLIIFCSDGELLAYPYPSIAHYDSLGQLAALLISAVCFFAILTPYTYRIIRRITDLSREMEVLTGGNLSYHIESRGKDEIAELGQNLEQMRLSVLSQMTREAEAVSANRKLVTSLSHDLRTPLAKLTGYLEILRYRKYRDRAEAERYLKNAAENAEQLKRLSDELFRSFQVQECAPLAEEEKSAYGAILLSQLLGELCFDLQGAGLDAQPPEIAYDFTLMIPTLDLKRVFDNLFSNIRKYADHTKPVTVSVSALKGEVCVTLVNSIGLRSSTDSCGIGLPTVRALLARNGGRLETEEADEQYTVRVFLTTK